MKKVVRYVSKFLDSQNRQLLNQYLHALHGRLEHEWVPGDTRASDVAFVQTRQQLDELPGGCKPIAFMPREGSTVAEAATVIDRPHLIQTFARSLNRSADDALTTHPPQKRRLAAVPQPVRGPEYRRPLNPISELDVPSYPTLAEAFEHARRAGLKCFTIAAPEGWRLFVDVSAKSVYVRPPANRRFGTTARFLNDLRGVCQLSALADATLVDDIQGLPAQDLKTFLWELGLAQNARLLPWIPAQGQLGVRPREFPEGLALAPAQTELLQALTKQSTTLADLSTHAQAPRHVVYGLLNAMEMVGALSITELRAVAAPPPGFLRRDAMAA
jgi:hypothetical protein